MMMHAFRPPSVRFVVAVVALTACGRAGHPPPPDTPRLPVADTMHGVVFGDDYRWLEDQNAHATRAWIAAQNAYTDLVLNDSLLRDSLAARLRGYVDVPDVGDPIRRGPWEYFTLRRRGDELASIVRRTAPTPDHPLAPIDPGQSYEVVIDPRHLSADLTTRVSLVSVSPGGEYLLYSMRHGGADERSFRIRDLRRGTDRADSLPRALYASVTFSHDGLGVYYVRRDRRRGPRLRYHQLGDDPRRDRVLFGEGIGPQSFLTVNHLALDRYRLITVQHGWVSTDVYFQDVDRDPTPRPVLVGNGARNYARYQDGELWVQTNDGAPNNRVVAIDPDHPNPDRWREVIAEREHVLQSYSVLDDRIYATYLENVSTRIRVLDLHGRPIGELPVPDGFSASIRGAGYGAGILTLESFAAPSAEYRVDLASGERIPYRAPWIDYDADGIEVSQTWYPSRDGTGVPMYLVHRRDVALDGSAPTLLTGYGGFNAAQVPEFSALAATWVDMGGVYARANLRGGSEFGEAWHRDGMLERKQNVVDDFIAAAEWLVANGYTNSDRLAIRGGSNGGLVVAAAFTQRPRLFRAAICAFPDLDMVRFWQFTDVNNQPALLEYGDGSIAEQFRYLSRYSPYQAVQDGVHYPAVLFKTGDLDTRVPPLQARKMTARMQAASVSGHPILLRDEEMHGHAAHRGRPFSRMVTDTAEELMFLVKQVGMR